MMRLLLCLGCALGLGLWLPAQDLLGTYKLEDFETDADELYPYEQWGPMGNADYLTHEPTLRLGDGSLAMLWKPDKINARKRRLSRFNLLLEESWTAAWQLDRNEYILGMVQQGDTVVVLTGEHEFFQQQHLIRARRWRMRDGQALTPKLLHVVQGRQYDEILFEAAPDGQGFVLYHLGHQRPNRRVGFSYRFLDSDQHLGYFAHRVRHVFFTVYDADLAFQRRDTLTLPDRRHTLLGCGLDQARNFYAFLFRRKGKIKVFCAPPDGSGQQMLSYDPDLRDVYDFEPEYRSHLTPALGQPGRVWWAFADRKRRGRDRGIKRYQVALFDFNAGAVDLTRELPVTSALLVAAEKQREAYHLRPMKRFDEYRIMELFELPDSSVWLVTQKYVYTNFNTSSLGYTAHDRVEERAEELILFEFDPAGEIRKALVVPSVQYARNRYDRMGLFYQARLDTATRHLHLLTREASGERMRRPDRLYYRKLDLNTGRVAHRVQLYDGEKRYQYWIKGYSTWLTPGIVVNMIIDGSNGKPYLLSTNLDAEPSESEAHEAKGE